MKLIQWTLFIDMLGYRAINGEIKSDKDALDFVSFMDENKSIFESQDNELIQKSYFNESFNLYDFYDIKKAFVSDSVIVTYFPKKDLEPDQEKMLFFHSANAIFIITMRLQTFIYNCLLKGIFLRGGISNKYCYIKDEFVVGEGVIEAYQAESEDAKYPRIVFSKSVFENKKLLSAYKMLDKGMYNESGLLTQDSDGIFYINYLNYAITSLNVNLPPKTRHSYESSPFYKKQQEFTLAFIHNHQNMIKRKIKESKNNNDNRVLSKYLWLKEYHNTTVKNHSLNNFIID